MFIERLSQTAEAVQERDGFSLTPRLIAVLMKSIKYHVAVSTVF